MILFVITFVSPALKDAAAEITQNTFLSSCDITLAMLTLSQSLSVVVAGASAEVHVEKEGHSVLV